MLMVKKVGTVKDLGGRAKEFTLVGAHIHKAFYKVV